MQSTRTTDKTARTIRTRFVIPGTEHERHGRTAHKVLELSTHHDKNRKEYRSRVSRVSVDALGGTREVVSFWDAPAPLASTTTPADHYSARTLDDLHIEFESRAAGADTFASLIEWAKEAAR